MYGIVINRFICIQKSIADPEIAQMLIAYHEQSFTQKNLQYFPSKFPFRTDADDIQIWIGSLRILYL